MRLILEGIDGVGKTTILDYIERGRRVRSVHLTKPPKGVTPHQWSDYFRRNYDEFQLLSRSHVSERVYGSLIRGKSLIDDWQNWLLNQQLRARGFRIAYIDRDYDLVKEQILAREKPSDYDLWVLDNWDKMRETYLKLLPPDLTVFIPNNDQLAAVVASCVSLGEPLMFTNPSELRGTGSLFPRLIVLGDEFTRRRWNTYYAKPFDFGEASKMVFRAIGHLPNVYVANTNYPDLGDIRSQFQLDAELRRFPGVPIITLGTEALTRVRKLGREAVATIPHPQYWRRFKYHDQEGWIQDFRLVAERHHG